jgi:hypothetical protein
LPSGVPAGVGWITHPAAADAVIGIRLSATSDAKLTTPMAARRLERLSDVDSPAETQSCARTVALIFRAPRPVILSP